jgi:hypothetical protein
MEKEVRQQRGEAPVLHCGEHAVAGLFILFTFGSTSKVIHPKRIRVGRGTLISSIIFDDDI